ncbi:fibronectin type III domain-containing protein [candidate division KSB1 bacterium]|nr:fibronectin type III domain-containing protein [candidate division KSB1 bacterium]RQW02446.1 MAG: fibronectin type III domain-containing protein [candidate division KSB1 bacterium]
MARVTNPLFTDFFEAFADVIVYQHNGSSSPIARRKVKHPINPRSAHYQNRIANWSKAISEFNNDEAPDEELLNYVAFHALSPDRPTNLRTTALFEDPQNATKQRFTIKWDAPTTKYNGHPLDNLYGYFVECSQNFITWIRLTTDPITETEYTDSIDHGDFYFIVLAIDTEGNVSSPSEQMFLELTSEPAYYDMCHYDLVYYAQSGA